MATPTSSIDASANEYGNDEITAALDAESDSYTEEGAKAARTPWLPQHLLTPMFPMT